MVKAYIPAPRHITAPLQSAIISPCAVATDSRDVSNLLSNISTAFPTNRTGVRATTSPRPSRSAYQTQVDSSCRICKNRKLANSMMGKLVGERGFEPPTPWSRKWGAGRPPVVSQISPEGPQAIKGLGIEVWDGDWLIYRIGGPQFLEFFSSRRTVRVSFLW
jgi:hypothetical protein